MTMIERTTGETIAIEQVQRQAIVDGYGPLFIIQEIGRGHERHDAAGICPTCGRIQAHGPAWDRDAWLADMASACFEAAEFTVEFTYNEQGHRALYGVPAEGAPSCWAS